MQLSGSQVISDKLALKEIEINIIKVFLKQIFKDNYKLRSPDLSKYFYNTCSFLRKPILFINTFQKLKQLIIVI